MFGHNDTDKCAYGDYVTPPSKSRKDIVVQLVLSGSLGAVALIAFCVRRGLALGISETNRYANELALSRSCARDGPPYTLPASDASTPRSASQTYPTRSWDGYHGSTRSQRNRSWHLLALTPSSS